MKLACESAEAFVQRSLREVRDRGTWLVLSGGTGTGKTHLAKRVRTYHNSHLIEAWSKGWLGAAQHIAAAEWVGWPSACRRDDDDWEEKMADIMAARMVIVDDAGAEVDPYRSDAPKARLQALLDACERKWLLLTTNVEPGPAWRERFGVRSADRMMAARRVSLFATQSGDAVPSWRVH